MAQPDELRLDGVRLAVDEAARRLRAIEADLELVVNAVYDAVAAFYLTCSGLSDAAFDTQINVAMRDSGLGALDDAVTGWIDRLGSAISGEHHCAPESSAPPPLPREVQRTVHITVPVRPARARP